MSRRRRGSYVRDGSDVVERGCTHCDWSAVADSYPELVEQYQQHLRAEHPTAWLRT